MFPFGRALLAGLMLVGAAVFVTACGDDTNSASSETSTSQGSVDDLTARVQRNETITAFTAIDALPLHGMNEEILGGAIESNHIPTTRTLLRYLGITDWGELQGDADAIKASAVELLAALENDDLEAAGPPSTEVHDLWHDFEGTFWEHVAADIPESEGGPGGGDHGASTPAAGATETGDDHSG